MGRYTQDLVQSGALGTARGAAEDEVERVRGGEAFREWVAMCVQENVPMRISGAEHNRLVIKTSILEASHRPQALMDGNYARGWTGKPASDQVRLTPEGLAVLPDDLRAQVERRATFGVLEHWMAHNGSLVEGHAARAAIAEAERPDVQAFLRVKEGEVLVRVTVFRDLYGKVPAVLVRRVGSLRYVMVDLSVPEELLDVLRGSMDDTAEETQTAQPPVSEEKKVLPFATTPARRGDSVQKPLSLWEQAEIEQLQAEAARVPESQEEREIHE